MTIWHTWSGDSASTTTTGTWHTWTSDTVDATSSTTYTVSGEATWRYWGTTDSYSITYNTSVPIVIHTPKETVEQKRARVAQVRINAEWRLMQAKEVEESRKESENRALELLLDIIGENQLAVFNKTGRVLVEGKKYQWMVHKSGKVQRITNTTVVDLCVHLRAKYSYPDTDNVIAMVLAAKLDEDDLVKKANVVTRRNMTMKYKNDMREAANF